MSKRYEQWGYESYRDNETGLVASNHIEVMNEQDQKIKELEHRLSNCIELPCIQKRTIYPDINSMRTKEEWYVVFKKEGYRNEIFTIKCGSELSAKKELEELKNG